MFDAEAPSSKLVLAELMKPKVPLDLRRIAKWSTGSDADAEDLVEDALMLVMDPAKWPWDPEKRTFLTHMGFVMKYVWGHQRGKARGRREIIDEGLARDEKTQSREPRVDDELERLRSFAALQPLGRRLRADQADDPVATDILNVGMEEGAHEPEELAELLPHPVEDIRAALKRIRYRARQILDEWNESEERRMKELRERGAKTESEAAS